MPFYWVWIHHSLIFFSLVFKHFSILLTYCLSLTKFFTAALFLLFFLYLFYNFLFPYWSVFPAETLELWHQALPAGVCSLERDDDNDNDNKIITTTTTIKIIAIVIIF